MMTAMSVREPCFDVDLIGVPLRVIVSNRNMKQNMVEIISRDKSFSSNVTLGSAAEEILKIIYDSERWGI